MEYTCAICFKCRACNKTSYFNELLILNNDRHFRLTHHRSLTFVPPKYPRITEGGRACTVSTTILLHIRSPSVNSVNGHF